MIKVGVDYSRAILNHSHEVLLPELWPAERPWLQPSGKRLIEMSTVPFLLAHLQPQQPGWSGRASPHRHCHQTVTTTMPCTALLSQHVLTSWEPTWHSYYYASHNQADIRSTNNKCHVFQGQAVHYSLGERPSPSDALSVSNQTSGVPTITMPCVPTSVCTTSGGSRGKDLATRSGVEVWSPPRRNTSFPQTSHSVICSNLIMTQYSMATSISGRLLIGSRVPHCLYFPTWLLRVWLCILSVLAIQLRRFLMRLLHCFLCLSQWIESS